MLEGLPQNDTRLINYILNKHLLPPPSSTILERALKSSTKNIELRSRISSFVLKILKRKVNNWLFQTWLDSIFDIIILKILQMEGFFLEYRAYDGEFRSKTLELEKMYKWTGVLIEPDSALFPKLVSTHRKAWVSNICLSPDPHSQKMEFIRSVLNNDDAAHSNNGNLSQLEIKLSSERKRKHCQRVRISCFPLFSILSALNVKKVDFLVLSAQGLELQILLNLPWHLVFIKVQNLHFLNKKY